MFAYLEFLVQSFNIILHTLDQLGLVLANGTTNVRSHEQCVEAGKDTEHLVGVLGGSQLVAETSRYPGLNTIDPLVVALDGTFPGISSFLGHVETIHIFYILIGKINLLRKSSIADLDMVHVWSLVKEPYGVNTFAQYFLYTAFI